MMLNEFNAGTYSDLFKTHMGEDLWEFLNSENSLIRLETATFLKRPALEGIQSQLLEEFKEKIREDRWKQMTGRMVRQIMEIRNYMLDQTGVKIRVGDLFKTATRYRKKD